MSFPITLGTEYGAPNRKYSVVVTAVDDDEVHYVIKTYFTDGTTSLHCPMSASRKIFTELYTPLPHDYLAEAAALLKRFVEVPEDSKVINDARVLLAKISGGK